MSDKSIESEIKRWIKDNLDNSFMDKNGTKVKLISATTEDIIYKTDISGIKSKPIRLFVINGQHLNTKNAYDLLSSFNNLDNITENSSDVFVYGVNQWANINEHKWFNKETMPFRILGAQKSETDTYTPIIIIQNNEGNIKSVPITNFAIDGKRLNIGNALEYFKHCDKFDVTFSFADRNMFSEASAWINKNKKTITDQSGAVFEIVGIKRLEQSNGIAIIFKNENDIEFERAINAIKVNGNTMKSKDLMKFLTEVQHIDNKFRFSATNKATKKDKSERHELPDIKELKEGTGLRLENGQCAKVIALYTKQNNCGLLRTFDIIVEDGTIIKGLTEHKLRNGLWNTNKNAPILNKLKKHTSESINIDESAKWYFAKMMPQKTGVSSMTEIAYMNYLTELGFQEAKQAFLKEYFGIADRRYPDGFMIRDGKMVIFEYDGYAGHGNIVSRNNIQKDVSKNEMYQNIVECAKNGQFLPHISDVMVLRVRGTNVPLLRPDNVCEITQAECKSPQESIEKTLSNMTQIMDEQFGWNTSKELENIILQTPITIYVPNKSNHFEVSKMIGRGTPNDRCGQFAAIQCAKQEAKKLLPSSTVEVIFETGERTMSTYKLFLEGRVKNREAIKVYDFGRDGQNLSEKQYKHTQQTQPEITYDEIVAIRNCFPIVNGMIQQKQSFDDYACETSIQKTEMHDEAKEFNETEEFQEFAFFDVYQGTTSSRNPEILDIEI